MTFTTKTQGPTTPSGFQTRSGFQPIPTRIRDVRDAQVPPLVVEPADQQRKAAVEQSLAELGIKLAEIHRTAAEAYLSHASYDKALPHLQAAVTLAPGESEYQHQLGFVRYVTGDDLGAIQSFNAVLAADATNSDAWFNLGMVLFGQNQFGEAETCFGRSIEHNGSDAQTWNNRGVCLWQLGRQAEARASFQRALQIDPSDADARFNLANVPNPR
jgi:Flp pilus assembly protein TadD